MESSLGQGGCNIRAALSPTNESPPRSSGQIPKCLKTLEHLRTCFKFEERMSENPKDWRSAVDPKSGRTYWYHRETRASTWTRPNFIEDVVPQPVHVDDKKLTSSQPVAHSAAKTQDVAQSLHHYDSSPSDPTLRFQSSSNSDVNEQRLADLYRAIDSTSPDELSDNSALVSDLANLVLGGHPKACRVRALKCLWRLTFSRIITTTAFQLNQSWINMWKICSRWEDYESVLLLAAIFSNLSIGPTASLVPSDALSFLSSKLEEVLPKFGIADAKATKSITLDIVDFLLNEHFIGWCIMLAQRSHSLAASVLLVLAHSSLRDEKLFASAVACSFLSALQQICICKGLEEGARKRAKSLLQSYMTSSSFVRDKVLDGFLELSSTLGEIPIPNGPEPAVYQHEFTLQDDDAVELWSHLRDNGSLDVVDKTPEVARLERILLQRDVEWIPQSGTSWHLCSSLLWARCPALHEIIQGFWEQGGGGLELSIDSSDQVVASVCHFIHSGLLRAPPALEDQLELLRVSTQLGMATLQKAVEDSIGMKLTLDSVDMVLAFCEQMQLPALARCCNTFLQSGKRPASIRLQSDKGADSASLKNAIYESLQDVSSLLNHTTTGAASAGSTAPASVGPSLTALAADDDLYGFHEQDSYDWDSRFEEENSRGTSSTLHAPHVPPSSKAGSKLKSGGIYALLLQQQGEGGHQSVAPLEASRMPGKVMHDKEPAAKRKPEAAKDKDKAKKYSSPDHSFEDPQYDVAVLEVGGINIREYRPGMTLEPPKAKSEREKRWDTLSQPRHRESKAGGKDNKLRDSIEPDGAELLDNSFADATPAAATAKSASAPAAKPKAAKQEPPAATGPKAKPVAPPKPSVEPIQLPAASTSTSDEAPVEAPPKVVRSSLALLKAKTVRGRRRVNARDDEVQRSDDFEVGRDTESEAAVWPCAPETAEPPRPAPRLAQNHPLSQATTARGWADPTEQSRAQRGGSQPHPASIRAQTRYDDEDEGSREETDEEERNFDGHGDHNDEYEVRSAGGGDYDVGAGLERWDEEQGDDSQREPCPDCGRRFMPQSLARHIKICQKVFVKKRKVFDSAKKRVEAIPELQSLLKEQMRGKGKGRAGAVGAAGKTQQPQTPGGASKWKAQSEAFRAAMRAMKETNSPTKGGADGGRPVEPYVDPSLIQCPHCQRRFNQKAAERHIPVCQNIVAKPSSLRKGSGQNASTGQPPKTPSTLKKGRA